MKNKTIVALSLSALFLATAAAYLAHRPLMYNILYLIAPLTAIIAGIYAVRTFKLSNNTGQVFALLTAGLSCFFIGELLFTSYQYVFHIDPFPSVADIFYIAAYPLLFAGFAKAIFNHRVKWHNFSKVFLLLIITFLMSLGVLVAYFGVVKAYSPGDTFLSNAISIAYGLGDLIIIIPSLFILKVVMDFRGGKLFYSWVLMLIALICFLAGDLLFGIYREPYGDLVWPYPLIDLTYVAAYLLFAFSFYYTAVTVQELGLKLKPPSPSKK